MKTSLKKKTVLAIVCMSLVMGIMTVFLAYRLYARSMDDHYMSLAENLANTAAGMVDAEKIRQYVRTRQTDQEYEQQREILRCIQQSNGVDSIYILELMQEETCTIMDTDPEMELWHIDLLVQPMAQSEDSLVYISNTESYGWLCSAMVWMRDEAGKGYAVMCVDISMNEVMADRMEFLRVVGLAVCAVMLAACIVLVVLVSRFVTGPINQLTDAAGRYVSERRSQDGTDTAQPLSLPEAEKRGSAISQLRIDTGDEIESLSESIKKMEQEINEYIRNLTAVTAEKERIGAELNVAAHIQASMLPCIFPAFPSRQEFDIYAAMIPAKEVGGDFYDFFLVDEDHLAIVIADVSGKGVPAALFMVIAKTLIKDHAQTGASPGDVFTEVNRQLCESNDEGLFVTAWMGVVELSTGHMVYVNAGHNPPLVRRGGVYEYLRVRPGFVLAGMEGMKYRQAELDLAPGDVVYLYTDGITEATDAQEQLYGEQRLLTELNRQDSASPRVLLEAVRESVDRFVADAPQFDDMTMLGFLFRGAADRGVMKPEGSM